MHTIRYFTDQRSGAGLLRVEDERAFAALAAELERVRTDEVTTAHLRLDVPASWRDLLALRISPDFVIDDTVVARAGTRAMRWLQERIEYVTKHERDNVYRSSCFVASDPFNGAHIDNVRIAFRVAADLGMDAALARLVFMTSPGFLAELNPDWNLVSDVLKVPVAIGTDMSDLAMHVHALKDARPDRAALHTTFIRRHLADSLESCAYAIVSSYTRGFEPGSFERGRKALATWIDTCVPRELRMRWLNGAERVADDTFTARLLGTRDALFLPPERWRITEAHRQLAVALLCAAGGEFTTAYLADRTLGRTNPEGPRSRVVLLNRDVMSSFAPGSMGTGALNIIAMTHGVMTPEQILDVAPSLHPYDLARWVGAREHVLGPVSNPSVAPRIAELLPVTVPIVRAMLDARGAWMRPALRTAPMLVLRYVYLAVPEARAVLSETAGMERIVGPLWRKVAARQVLDVNDLEDLRLDDFAMSVLPDDTETNVLGARVKVHRLRHVLDDVISLEAHASGAGNTLTVEDMCSHLIALRFAMDHAVTQDMIRCLAPWRATLLFEFVTSSLKNAMVLHTIITPDAPFRVVYEREKGVLVPDLTVDVERVISNVRSTDPCAVFAACLELCCMCGDSYIPEPREVIMQAIQEALAVDSPSKQHLLDARRCVLSIGGRRKRARSSDEEIKQVLEEMGGDSDAETVIDES